MRQETIDYFRKQTNIKKIDGYVCLGFGGNEYTSEVYDDLRDHLYIYRRGRLSDNIHGKPLNFSSNTDYYFTTESKWNELFGNTHKMTIEWMQSIIGKKIVVSGRICTVRVFSISNETKILVSYGDIGTLWITINSIDDIVIFDHDVEITMNGTAVKVCGQNVGIDAFLEIIKLTKNEKTTEN